MPAGTTDGLTARREIVGRQRLALSAREERWVVAPNLSRAERVMRLVRVGEQEVSGEDQAEVDAYFAPHYAFHGPDGAEMDYEGLKGYFASLRAAFDGLSIGRGSWSSSVTTSRVRRRSQGPSLREFTRSPVGPLPPNGRRVVFELINIFRYDDRGRVAEEWVQKDIRCRLRQLGAEGR